MSDTPTWDAATPETTPGGLDSGDGTRPGDATTAPGAGPDRLGSPEMPGAAAGRYQLLGEIARGGMGAVLLGRDADLGRDLAVKVLLEAHRDRPEMRRRFVEEARISGQLQHPGIVPVYELGAFADARPFFAMKLVRGRTLAAMLAGRGSPAAERPRFLATFEQVCQTVAYAHSRGVIHRDLKPSNVMVGAFGEVQVMDWGLAKVLPRSGATDDAGAGRDGGEAVLARSDADAGHSRAGSVLGTPAYMAPEQARGEVEAVDERADVFGLGSILCEILTGQPAYAGPSISEVLRQARRGDTAPALARLEGCGADGELIALARAALGPEPGDRPRDASALARGMTAYLAGVQERLRASEFARVEATARARAERARRKFAVALAASLLLALAIGGGSWTAFRLDRQARRAEAEGIIGEALARAEAARAEAERDGTPAPWERALIAADKACATLAGRPARAEFRARAERLQAAVAREVGAARGRVARAEAIRVLADRLDEARMRGTAVKDGRYDIGGKLAAYEEAFRAAGIDPTGGAAELEAREGAERIAAALDDWAADDPGRRDRLDALARAIDPGRNRLRDAIRRGDRTALTELAAGGESRALPAASAVILARAVHAAGGHAEAMELLARARRRSPGDFWLNHELGWLCLRATPPRKADAVRLLSAAVALEPDSPGAALSLGIALDEAGEREEALAAFREAVRLKPDYPQAYFNLGNVLKDMERWGEAADAYRAALRVEPDYARPHNNLGVVLASLGRREEAEAAYRQAIRTDPGHAMARNNLAFLLGGRGRPEEAAALLREAIRLAPEFPEAYLNLGSALGALGRHDEAAAAFREAVRIRPGDAGARIDLGRALRRLGMQGEAEAQFREAVRIRPDDAAGHYNLGVALQAQGQDDGAIAAYREAIRLQPDLAEARCNLGLRLMYRGAYREALEHLRTGHELGSARPGWRYPSARWVEECEAKAAASDEQ